MQIAFILEAHSSASSLGICKLEFGPEASGLNGSLILASLRSRNNENFVSFLYEEFVPSDFWNNGIVDGNGDSVLFVWNFEIEQ